MSETNEVKQGTCFCFTLNNPIMKGEELLEHFKVAGANLVVFQLEEGESGTPHFQGYVRFTKRMRLGNLKKVLPQAHWENRKKPPKAAIAYCKKEEGRIEGPWEWTDGATTAESGGKCQKFTESALNEIKMWEEKNGRKFRWETEWAIMEEKEKLGRELKPEEIEEIQRRLDMEQAGPAE